MKRLISVSLLLLILPMLACATSTAAHIVPTATISPTATATPPGPQVISVAVLGASQDVFSASYGVPQMTGDIPHYTDTITDSSLEDIQLTICYCSTSVGLDGAQRVTILGVYPLPHQPWPWTQNAAAIVTRLFSPPDAIYQRTIHDPQVGTIQVYTSADLAQTFPASEFTDSASGATLPPGTFSVDCNDPVGAGCTFTTGT